MSITKSWGKAVVVAGCLSVMGSAAHAGYDTNVGAATDSTSTNTSMSESSTSSGSMSGMSRSDMRMKNAQMLIQTLSEEKTEIHSLHVQRMALMHMGGMENMRLARTFGRWEAEHKAAGPMLMHLCRVNGGNPADATIFKPPVLGSTAEILMAQHKDHEAAVMTSQMRFNMTDSGAIKMAMHKRANLARKHLRQMMPFHSMMMNTGMSGMDNSGAMQTTTVDRHSTTTRSTTVTNTTAADGSTMTDNSSTTTAPDTSSTTTTTTTAPDTSTTTNSSSSTTTTPDSTMAGQ